MTSMTSEALRAAPDIWKRPNLPPGVSKDEKKIDFAKIRIIIVLLIGQSTVDQDRKSGCLQFGPEA